MTARGTPPEEPTRSVDVPEITVAKVERRLPGTEFESVDAYVAFALDQVLRELHRAEERDDGTASGAAGGTDAAEHGTADDAGGREDGATDDDVAERLESLGYL